MGGGVKGQTARAHRISKTDGFEVADLLHFGLDHVAGAELLLRQNARYFDSAGYLAHIGIELLLKAWLLEVAGSFPKIHSLKALWNEISQHPGTKSLTAGSSATLAFLDEYEKLRYPSPHYPIEVGSDDVPKLSGLMKALSDRMPLELHEAIAKLDGASKGGRILMERRKRAASASGKSQSRRRGSKSANPG